MRKSWEKKKVSVARPERGPVPMSRSLVDLNSDVDVLQRRIGEQQDSAATIEDLAKVGIVRQATDGSIIATPKNIGGPQALYDYLKGFN
jgi:hypothetical protein